MDIVPQAGMNFQRIFGRIHGEHVFRPGTLSFVVAGALPDLEGPVELFQQHDPGQVVGEGHGGHGQFDPGLPLQALRQAVGAADDKGLVLGGSLVRMAWLSFSRAASICA